jgi:hypothetical protein
MEEFLKRLGQATGKTYTPAEFGAIVSEAHDAYVEAIQKQMAEEKENAETSAEESGS